MRVQIVANSFLLVPVFVAWSFRTVRTSTKGREAEGTAVATDGAVETTCVGCKAQGASCRKDAECRKSRGFQCCGTVPWPGVKGKVCKEDVLGCTGDLIPNNCSSFLRSQCTGSLRRTCCQNRSSCANAGSFCRKSACPWDNCGRLASDLDEVAAEQQEAEEAAIAIQGTAETTCVGCKAQGASCRKDAECRKSRGFQCCGTVPWPGVKGKVCKEDVLGCTGDLIPNNCSSFLRSQCTGSLRRTCCQNRSSCANSGSFCKKSACPWDNCGRLASDLDEVAAEQQEAEENAIAIQGNASTASDCIGGRGDCKDRKTCMKQCCSGAWYGPDIAGYTCSNTRGGSFRYPNTAPKDNKLPWCTRPSFCCQPGCGR